MHNQNAAGFASAVKRDLGERKRKMGKDGIEQGKKKKHTAIVLAAGKGTRMQADIPKQYLELNGRPVLYYSLKAFEESFVDEIILVTGKNEAEYCKSRIVDRYGFHKVTHIVAGGAERFLSVYQGLLAAKDADYVYIHDGARPFLTDDILRRARQSVLEYGACAAGMPVKDTKKIVDERDFAVRTPDRKFVWMVQTPQVFAYAPVKEAYDRLLQQAQEIAVTDDAMVVETMLEKKVKLFFGSYENIKITTPEDLQIAEKLLEQYSQEKNE